MERWGAWTLSEYSGKDFPSKPPEVVHYWKKTK